MTKEERLLKDGYGSDCNPVRFFHPSDHCEPYGSVGVFSNFSQHAVELVNPWTGEVESYKTGEHRFQAMKGTSEIDCRYVMEASSPSVAKTRGREILLRDGWGNDYGDLCWYVMAELVLAKTIQHPSVGAILAGTVGQPIWEDSPVDDIWGIRFEQSYTGKNLLGRAWEQTRAIMGMT